MKKPLYLLVAGLLSVGGITLLTINEPASSDTVTVSDALANIDVVIRFHEQKTVTDPFSFPDFRLLGSSYAERGRLSGKLSDYRNAETAFQKSVGLQIVRNESAIVGLAHALQSQHKFSAAESVLVHSWAVVGNFPNAIAVRGDVSFELGNYETADSLYREFALIEPGLAAWSRQAKMAIHQGNWEHARVLWERICALPSTGNESEMAWAWVMHGELYLRAGKLEKARGCFDRSLNILPGFSLALEHLAETFELEREFARAIPLLDSAIASSNHADLLFRRADLAEWEGDAKYAAELRTSGRNQLEVELAAGDIGHRRVLIDLLLNEPQDQARALELAQQEYTERADIGAEITLARALSAAGDHTAAARHARLAVRFGSYEPGIFLDAAAILRLAGENGMADSLESVANRMNPSFDQAGA